MNLLQLFVEFLISKKDKPSLLTVKNYKADIGQFIAWFENQFKSPFNPSLVTLQILDQYRKTRNLSPSSIQRHLSSLRKFFGFLKEKGLISYSPLEKETVSAEALAKEDPWMLRNFKSFLYDCQKSNLTIKNYINDIKSFFTWFEEVALTKYAWIVTEKNLLTKINYSVVEEYKQRLIVASFSPLTINRKLSSLRNYISWAQSQGFIETTQDLVENATATEEDNEAIEDILPSRESSFPPVRLANKSARGISLLFDILFILPLAKSLENTQYLFWKLTGKNVFTKKNILKEDAARTSNIKRDFYAPLTVSTRYLPAHKRAWHHIRHVRPNWYKRYHSYSFTHYLHFAALLIFSCALGLGIYTELFAGAQKQNSILAAVTSAPPRILSFQGRLTDSADTPITTGTNILFSMYDDEASAVALWQETNLITPDSEGRFSVMLGKNTPIPDALFSQNSELFLGIQVGESAELSPRQQLATVPFASNSETLQGLEPITNTTKVSNVILALDSAGNLSIAGSKGHTFQTIGGQFILSGSVLSLTTVPGSNSRVEIVPDGIGKIDLSKPIQNSSNSNNVLAAIGSVEFDDTVAILATSSAQAALYINQNSTGSLISANTSDTAKFTVESDGDGIFAGDLAINGGDLTSSATTFNLLNSIVTTLNLGGAATSLVLGASTGTITIKNATTYIQGDITLGDATSDSLTFAGRIGQDSDIVPITTSGTNDLGSSSLPWDNIYVDNIYTGTTGLAGHWQRVSGAVIPTNITDDFLLGATSTGSAKFGITGIGGTTPTATIGGNLSLSVPTTAGASAFKYLNNSTLDIQRSPAGDVGGISVMFFSSNGNVGIGTTSPTEKLTTYGTSGTLRSKLQNTSTTGYAELQTQTDTGEIRVGASGSGTSGGVGSGGNSYIITDGKKLFLGSSTTTEQIVIDTSGNLGIGNLTPLSALDITGSASLSASLSLRGTGTAHTFNILDNGSLNIRRSVGGSATTSTAFYIQNNGNVGIGTTAPSGEFTLVGSMRWGSTAGTEPNTLSNDQGGSIELAGRSNMANPITNGAPYIDFHYGTGTAQDYNARIQNIGDNMLTFETLTGGRALTLNSGNVGIGTTAPLTLLDIRGNASASGNLSFQGSGTTHTFNILDNGTLNFQRSIGGDAGATTAMYIQNNGNVGIGTTSPLAPLHIAGNALLSNDKALNIRNSENTLNVQAVYLNTAEDLYIGDNSNSDDLILQVATGGEIHFSFNGDKLLYTSGAFAFQEATTISTTTTSDLTLDPGGDINTNNNWLSGDGDSEGLMIDDSGNVGIGTSVPLLRLDVRDSQAATAAAQIYNTNSGTDADGLIIKLGNTSTTAVNANNHFVNFETFGIGVVGSIQGNGGTGVTYATSGIADFAEYFKKDRNLKIDFGSVVCLNDSGLVVPCDQNHGKILGIASERPAFLGGENLGDGSITVGLVGQVYTLVSLANGPIKPGDTLSASDIPGVAVKTIKAGQIVGKALENLDTINESEVVGYYDPQSKEYRSKATFPNIPLKDNIVKIVKINTSVNISWHDPNVYLANNGDLIINKDSDEYSVTNSSNQTLTNSEGFFEIVSANIRGGLIKASEIITTSLIVTTDTILVNGQNLRDYIVQVVRDAGFIDQTATVPSAQINEISTNIISPLGESLIVRLATPSSEIQNPEFIIQNSSGSAIATINNEGDASFSGQLSASSGQFEDASISGTLRTDTIIANNIEGLENQDFSFLTSHLSSDYIDVASFSAQLAYVPNLQAEQALFNQGLMVFGSTSLSDLSVAGNISIGGTMFITENSIETLGTDLALQSLRQGNLSIMGGRIFIDTEGNITTQGDLTVGGKLAVNIISPLPSSDLVVNNASGSSVLSINKTGDITASGSGTFAKLNFSFVQPVQALSLTEAIASSSAGVANIAPYRDEITIRNALVTDKSIIYITPVGTPSAQAPFLMRQKPALSGVEGSFTVGIQSPTNKPTDFNWLIIN